MLSLLFFRIRKASSYFFLLLIITGFSNRRQIQWEAEEYDLKAAFMYNFTRYIEWDASVTDKEFIIGVIGSSPINERLEEIARTKNVNNKKIIIRKFSTPDEISFCHILFISRDASFPLDEILAKEAIKGTLIVSEKSGFAAQGTAINFIRVNNKLKFEANMKVINSAGLKVSSQLLKLAIIVDQG